MRGVDRKREGRGGAPDDVMEAQEREEAVERREQEAVVGPAALDLEAVHCGELEEGEDDSDDDVGVGLGGLFPSFGG